MIWYSGLVEAAAQPPDRRCAAGASGVPGAGLPSIPNTPLMITSSVTACIRGASAKLSPIGQRSISRSATSEIICT